MAEPAQQEATCERTFLCTPTKAHPWTEIDDCADAVFDTEHGCKVVRDTAIDADTVSSADMAEPTQKKAKCERTLLYTPTNAHPWKEIGDCADAVFDTEHGCNVVRDTATDDDTVMVTGETRIGYFKALRIKTEEEDKKRDEERKRDDEKERIDWQERELHRKWCEQHDGWLALLSM